MPKVEPGRNQIKRFLDSAIVDPNKKGDRITQQLVEMGTPEYCELRVAEYMREASQLRLRMKTAHGKGLQTLREQYELRMRQAATMIAVAVGKVNGPDETPVKKRPGKANPGCNRSLPQDEGLGS